MDESKDDILDLAIEYAVRGCYKDGLSKDKKRAVRKRAKNLIVEKGEVYLRRKGGTVSYLRRKSDTLSW